MPELVNTLQAHLVQAGAGAIRSGILTGPGEFEFNEDT
jgi:hypothetical protein